MKAIELQPLGDVESDVLESLCPALRETFGVAVRIRDGAFPIEKFFDEHRGQYNSTAILHSLDHTDSSTHRVHPPRPNGDARVVGVTRHDLFIPILTYVFGEAALGGDVAVVSYHRFRNELYGLAPDHDLLLERTRKVAIHEIGHTLGLVHCSLQDCVMHAASYVEELDLKGHRFCAACRNAMKMSRHQPSSL